MSELKIKDFYGQNVAIHNGTASGNVRIEVRTTKDLNKVRLTKPEDCDLVTDISLTMSQDLRKGKMNKEQAALQIITLSKKINVIVGDFHKLQDWLSQIDAWFWRNAGKSNDKILFYNEIENGLHWRRIEGKWKELIENFIAQNAEKVFVSTHSWEVVQYLSEIYQKQYKAILGDNEIALFKIKIEEEGEFKILDYNPNMIKHAIEQEKEFR